MSKENKTKINKPVATFRDFPVSISVWKTTAKVDKKDVTFYNSTLQTSYKDDDGEYQNSNNFKPLDLLKTAQLCQKAYNFIKNAEDKDYADKKKDSDEEEEE